MNLREFICAAAVAAVGGGKTVAEPEQGRLIASGECYLGPSPVSSEPTTIDMLLVVELDDAELFFVRTVKSAFAPPGVSRILVIVAGDGWTISFCQAMTGSPGQVADMLAMSARPTTDAWNELERIRPSRVAIADLYRRQPLRRLVLPVPLEMKSHTGREPLESKTVKPVPVG